MSNIMDQVYSTVQEKRKYDKLIAKSAEFTFAEQEWYDTNMSPFQDLFGCIDFIHIVYALFKPDSNKNLQIIENKKPQRGDVVAKCDIMCSRGSEQSTHWLSKAKGNSQFFDPYDEFQYPGTNQWCQINALMNICFTDRQLSEKQGLEKYYEYNQQVVDFIQCVCEDPDVKPVVKHMWKSLDLPSSYEKCIRQIVTHPNRCFNVAVI